MLCKTRLESMSPWHLYLFCSFINRAPEFRRAIRLPKTTQIIFWMIQDPFRVVELIAFKLRLGKPWLWGSLYN